MKTKEQILEELAKGRKNEQNHQGHMIAGDIFYSDIWKAVKQNCKIGRKIRDRTNQFIWICNQLKVMNYHVHE